LTTRNPCPAPLDDWPDQLIDDLMLIRRTINRRGCMRVDRLTRYARAALAGRRLGVFVVKYGPTVAQFTAGNVKAIRQRKGAK
jgi:hypothetical protein